MSGWNDGDTNAVDTLERLFLAEQVPASAMHVSAQKVVFSLT